MEKPNYFEANFKQLIRQTPQWEAALNRASEDHITWLQARNGEWTIKFGKQLVHSSFDPGKEANRSVGHDPKPLHIHLGLGLGYLLAHDRGMDDSIFVIYEPNPELMRAFLNLPLEIDWQNTTFCPDLKSLEEHLIEPFKKDQELRVVMHPFHKKHHPEQIAQALELIEKMRQYRRMARSAMEGIATVIYKQSLLNLPKLHQKPDIEPLINAFKGKPAVVVAPGPSLEKNIQELIPYLGQVLLFATSRTVKTLAYHSIKPDFVVHIESKDFSSFIEGVPNLEESIFLLPDQVHTAIVDLHPNHNYVYTTPLNMVHSWLLKSFPQLHRTEIDTGGSVATDAFLLANACGCDPIILIGQDLALKNDKIYSDEGNNRNFKFVASNERMMPGYFGGQVKTLNNYQHFIFWYQDWVAKQREAGNRTEWINATEGGADIKGMKKMKLGHVAAIYFKEDVSPLLKRFLHPKQRQILPLGSFFEVQSQKIQHIQAIAEATLLYVERAKKALAKNQQEKLSKVLKQLGPLVESFEEELLGFDIFNGFMQKELNAVRDINQAFNKSHDVMAEIEKDLGNMEITMQGAKRVAEDLQPALAEVIKEFNRC